MINVIGDGSVFAADPRKATARRPFTRAAPTAFGEIATDALQVGEDMQTRRAHVDFHFARLSVCATPFVRVAAESFLRKQVAVTRTLWPHVSS